MLLKRSFVRFKKVQSKRIRKVFQWMLATDPVARALILLVMPSIVFTSPESRLVAQPTKFMRFQKYIPKEGPN